LIIFILLINCLSFPSLGNEFDEEVIELHFPQPEITSFNEYLQINVNGTNGHLYQVGRPVLPFYSTKFCFPFGTKVIDIEYDIREIKSVDLPDKIVPALKPAIPGIKDGISDYSMDPIVYASEELFPENWYGFYTGGGLDSENEHKTFLTVRIFPVRYSPLTDTIRYIENIEITVTFKAPEEDILGAISKYDLAVIAPSEFSDELQVLVDHKNNHNIGTIFKTIEEIYNEYPGVDRPEQIKYFIKDAIETWDIKYVLLMGGMDSLLWGIPRDDANQGAKDWHLPVRYSNLRESGNIYDPGFISDLYFADIYDSDGNFSSWDSNNDGIFAKWKGISAIGRDDLDFYPDVYVGRLPCRNNYEVEILVDKIIEYERSTIDSSWYNRIIAVAGDPFNDSIVGTNYYEGELIGDKILSYMSDFEAVKLYASNININMDYTPLTTNIKREISNGCGHLFFDGHGHPGTWNTGWPGGDQLIQNGGISIYDMLSIDNGGKLPVCVLGGCHSAQFNITLFTTLLRKPFTWTSGMPVPECLSWHLTRKINGGSIATISNTGLGYEGEGEFGDRDGDGLDEPDCVEAWGGYLERCFYKTFNEGKDILGETWGGAIRKYLDTYPGMGGKWDAKVVEEWALLGDPSLEIGGLE